MNDSRLSNSAALLLLSAAAVVCGLAACDGRKPTQAAAAAVEVQAIEVEAGATQLYVDKVGEVRGSQEVELRARVSGVLLKQEFVNGSIVQENQPLFTIDSREYRAQLASADAQLASAQANLARAQQDVARYEPLLAENAISKQVYDSAVAAAKEARAQVDASRAAIDQAKLAVDFATVRAPFTGRIGDAKVFEGALISAGVTTLAWLYMDDPAWVYFSVSEAEVLDYQRRMERTMPPPDAPKQVKEVQLTLSDGTIYPETGVINFVASALDATTGTFGLRAQFPNSRHTLIPGLFARIRVSAEKRQDAIVVPDRAVQQQLNRYFVTVVGAEDKAEMRAVVPGPRVGNRWVISEGLKAGDRVIVEGIQKARPGVPLKVTLVTLDQFDTPIPSDS